MRRRYLVVILLLILAATLALAPGVAGASHPCTPEQCCDVNHHVCWPPRPPCVQCIVEWIVDSICSPCPYPG